MTVTNSTSYASFTSMGTTGPYAFTFPVTPDETALTVILIDLAGVATTLSSSDYTAAPVNGSYLNGGNITLDVAAPAGYTVIIQRNVPEVQLSLFTDGMPQPYKTFELGLDKLTMICQQLQTQLTALATSQPLPLIFTACISVQVVDRANECSISDGQAYYRIPSILNGMRLVSVAACNMVAGVTGSMSIQVRNATTGYDMLSTPMTIDTGETDTMTAAIPAVISARYNTVHTGDQISLADVDSVHTTSAYGLCVELQFQL